MSKADVNTNKTINIKSHIMIAYYDDLDNIGRALREITAVFWNIEKKSAKAGLAVGEDKTKLMISMNVDNRYIFEAVNEFIYLGSVVNLHVNFILEVKRRIVLANRCCFGLSRHLSDKAFS